MLYASRKMRVYVNPLFVLCFGGVGCQLDGILCVCEVDGCYPWDNLSLMVGGRVCFAEVLNVVFGTLYKQPLLFKSLGVVLMVLKREYSRKTEMSYQSVCLSNLCVEACVCTNQTRGNKELTDVYVQEEP